MGDSQTNRQRLLPGLAVVGGLLMAPSASALEFGQISLDSHLNQPLAARVLLSSLTDGEQASLNVHIASPALFKRFGIERSSAVDNLDVTTASGPQAGQVVVDITTRRPVREPFVDFLLEAGTSSGSGLREYTVLLNPAGTSHTATAAIPSSANRDTSPAARGDTRIRSAANVVAATNASPSAGQPYGPVKQGETLSGIAASLRPPGATTMQMAVALYEANPQAFSGSMDRLISGARLSVPEVKDVRAISSADVQTHLAQSAASVASASHRSADNQQATPDSDNPPQASGELPPASLTVQSTTGGDASPAADAGTTSVEQSGAVAADRPFGQLSMPRAATWSDELAAKASNADANHQADAGKAASAAAAPVKPTTADSSPTGAAKSADVSPADVDDPPEDVIEGGQAGWLSPRNLLLGLLLLVLLGVGLILRRRQQYKPMPMNFDDIDPDANEESNAAPPPPGSVVEPKSGSGPAQTVGADQRVSVSTAPDAPTSSFANERMVNTADSVSGAAPAPSSADTDAFVPAILRQQGVTAEPDGGDRVPAKVDRADKGRPDDHITPGIEEEEPSRPDGMPVASATIDNEFADYDYDFESESESLPPQPGRQHDQGSEDEWSFAVDEASPAETPPAPEPDDSNASSGPDMLDPQAFNLDDAPEQGAVADAALDSDTLEIRLDLARMYIEMEDMSMARELLEEVATHGDETQKHKAQSLLEQC